MSWPNLHASSLTIGAGIDGQAATRLLDPDAHVGRCRPARCPTGTTGGRGRYQRRRDDRD